MELPRLIRVGPLDLEVRLDRHLAEHTQTDGRCWVSRQEIVLNPANGPDYQAVVLMHEVLHALWATTGLTERVEGELAEQVISALSPALVDTLRRNPELTRVVASLPGPHLVYVDPEVRAGQALAQDREG